MTKQTVIEPQKILNDNIEDIVLSSVSGSIKGIQRKTSLILFFN